MSEKTLLIAMFGAFIWGFRHAVDWDHIAAITDITSTQSSSRSGIYLGTLYAIGHSSVVAGLGLMAIFIGAKIPGWLDISMGYLVGLTLVMLGIYVAISLFRMRSGEPVRMRSRWSVLFNSLSYGYEWVRAIITHSPMRKPKKFFESYMPKTALLVGAIHGIGAETPTQVALFVGAVGFAGSYGASLLLMAFIVGMLLMNTIMIVISSRGYLNAEKNKVLYYGTFAATAAFSIAIGLMFLTGTDSLLPGFFPPPSELQTK